MTELLELAGKHIVLGLSGGIACYRRIMGSGLAIKQIPNYIHPWQDQSTQVKNFSHKHQK